MDILRLIYAILLIFFIPGYAAVQALFPRKGELDLEFDKLYRLALSMGLSIAIAVFDGFFLDWMTRAFGIYPSPGKGIVQEPYLSLSLWTITGVLFVIGWYRGAYPLIGIIHPSLYREAPPYTPSVEKIRDQKLKDLENMVEERARIKRMIKEYRMKEKSSAKSMRKYYQTKKAELSKNLDELDRKIDALQKEIEEGTEFE
jgi:hypothetical protein